MNDLGITDSCVPQKKLIVVGNKPPRKAGLAEEIDAFDFVLRLNRMNYLGPTGTRIDGLFLEANEEFKYRYTGGANKNRIKEAGKIFMRELSYSRFDNWYQYLAPARYNEIEIINDSFAIEATGFLKVTSPIFLLGHLLNTAWSKQYRIHITCLDVENRANMLDNDMTWYYHRGAGAIEQQYLLNQINSGTIIRLNDE